MTYKHGPGNRAVDVISTKQRYRGDAKQVATLCASPLTSAGIVGKFITASEAVLDTVIT